MYRKMLSFLEKSPVNAWAIHNIKETLEQAGFEKLPPAGTALCPGGRYYTERMGSAIMAFRLPQEAPKGFVIAAAHSDSPYLRLMDHAELTGEYVRLSVEKHGGLILSTWLDRPLSAAGTVMVKTEKGAEQRLVDMKKPVAVIPSMAPHLRKGTLDPDMKKDMVALFAPGGKKGSFYQAVARAAGCKEEDVLASDLFLYNAEKPSVWGPEDEYISMPRLDDMACVFCILEGFLEAEATDRIQVMGIFDCEEVGSREPAGGGSDFMPRSLRRVAAGLGADEAAYDAMLDQSWLISSDNAHAVHPNYPELFHPTEYVRMNGGPVLKHSVRYTTDAVSTALFKAVCAGAGVPVQEYSNRADLAGGATLGKIAMEKTSLAAVDIGIAQLAMHSCYETEGTLDTEYMVKAIKASFESRVCFEGGSFTLE